MVAVIGAIAEGCLAGMGAIAEGSLAGMGATTEGVGITDANFLEGHLSALLTRMGIK